MQSKLWTQLEISFLVENLQTNTIDIYNLFKAEFGPSRSYDSLQKKVQKLRSLHNSDETTEESDTSDLVDPSFIAEVDTPAFDTPTANYVPAPQGTQATQGTPASVVKENTKAFIEGLREMSEGVNFNLYQDGINSDKPSLVVCLTDLHFGKQTDNFNMEVGATRLETMPARILESGIIPDDIDEVVLLVGGDVVEGEDIYANQNGVLECPVIEQAKAVAAALWKAALNFKSTFNCKVRIETSPGNHGRMSKTASTDSNWDNVVSIMLGLIADGVNDPNIVVNVNFSFFKIFEVKGKRGMLYHYGTKHLGTPATQVKFAGWVINDKIDFIVHGHWHKWGVETYLGRPMISNGSLPGPDDLSRQMAMEEAPRQAWFMVQKNKPLYGFSFVEW